MEYLENKKSLERKKAMLTFCIIFSLSVMPSVIIKFSDRKEIIFISIMGVIILLSYKRICRLNQKLFLLKK